MNVKYTLQALQQLGFLEIVSISAVHFYIDDYIKMELHLMPETSEKYSL